jgi:hypothetical protein
MNKAVTYVTVLLVVFAGCKADCDLTGSGVVVSKSVDVLPLTRIENNSPFDIKIYPDTASYVDINADDNIIDRLYAVDSAGVLSIGFDNTTPFCKVNVDIIVHLPLVNKVINRGQGNVDFVGNLQLDSLFLESYSSGGTKLAGGFNYLYVYNEGNGNLNLSGSVKHYQVLTTGSTNIGDYSLLADSAFIESSSAGYTQFSVKKYLKVKMSGSGNIYYYGTPVVEAQVTGSGNVIKAD